MVYESKQEVRARGETVQIIRYGLQKGKKGGWGIEPIGLFDELSDDFIFKNISCVP